VPVAAAARAATSAHWPSFISCRHCFITFHLHDSTLQAKRLTVNQGVSHFAPRRLNDASKGRARNLHLFCSLFLVKPIQVRQSQGLDFVRGQRHLFKLMHRNACRLEEVGAGSESNPSKTTGSRHSSTPFFQVKQL
jgi:hypothetical protein